MFSSYVQKRWNVFSFWPLALKHALVYVGFPPCCPPPSQPCRCLQPLGDTPCVPAETSRRAGSVLQENWPAAAAVRQDLKIEHFLTRSGHWVSSAQPAIPLWWLCPHWGALLEKEPVKHCSLLTRSQHLILGWFCSVLVFWLWFFFSRNLTFSSGETYFSPPECFDFKSKTFSRMKSVLTGVGGGEYWQTVCMLFLLWLMEDEFLGVSSEALCITGGSLVEEEVDGGPWAPIQGRQWIEIWNEEWTLLGPCSRRWRLLQDVSEFLLKKRGKALLEIEYVGVAFFFCQLQVLLKFLGIFKN